MAEYKGTECPVCGELRFSRCNNCGWQYDPYQEKFTDEGSLMNFFSLDEAKEIWKKEHRPIDEVAAELIQAKKKECKDNGIPWGF